MYALSINHLLLLLIVHVEIFNLIYYTYKF